MSSQAIEASYPDAARPELAFDRGVPRTLVHKAAVSEVLLTDAVRTGTHRYTVAAQWPQHHVLFRSGTCPAGTADPQLLVETVRQAGIYLSHVYYDVPLHHPFVLTSLDYEIEPPDFRTTARTGPLSVLVDVTCRLDADTSDRFGMTLDATLTVDGRVEGRVGLCWQALGPERYERLRHPRGSASTGPAAPAAQALVLAAAQFEPEVFGRVHERDVMLADDRDGAPDSWRLRLDTAHPVYFDHSCDHIPGMSLIESFSQAAALCAARATGVGTGLLRWTLRSSAVSFLSFGELDAPVTITAERIPEPPECGRHTVRVAAEQGGRLLATAALIGVLGTAAAGGTR
ncbi:ScbA/BarX family gamma-butyrolactone biosynthesis protein [Streptomyces sp. 2132.2]|uniref:ScbA/BarX family gamma-butyrolactone biosynthesis protein n=1 Tax=Streptomyces sp. 2132.2 TaxID=2485161 RepID=UPI000F488500|nr:ScbA/BarX family gamma-butyrolactone biosynthesis protein [Streptomyces sp. 2132.2]